MSFVKFTLCAVHSISVIILCLFFAVYLPTFSSSFYKYEYKINDVCNTINIEENELMRVTAHLTDYMKNKHDDLRITAVVGGKERQYFNEKEIAHMVDVKNLFLIGFTLRRLSLAALLLTIIIMRFLTKNPWKLFLKADKIIIGVFLAFAIAITVIVSADFDSAFTTFHHIFFTNDLWILDPSKDLLLNMVPLPFFKDIALAVFSLFIVFIVLSVTVTALAAKRSDGI